jgi:hypothetical protein
MFFIGVHGKFFLAEALFRIKILLLHLFVATA